MILLGIRYDTPVNPRPLVLTCGNHLTVETILHGIPALRSGIARTPDSRQQWGDIASGHPPPGGWLGAELDDVVNSPAQWSAILRSAVSRSWFSELGDRGQTDVRDHIAEIVGGLTVPRDDRGSDCVPGGKPPSALRDWYEDPRLRAVCNHNTREHMPQDLFRYLFAAAFADKRGKSPRLGDFPPALLPQHGNVSRSLGHNNFADRFRVQIAAHPATTVLSHIAKDGHYFIHPDAAQARSLTVREVARLQTFPDNYFFCGNRSDQYTQVGNAVPPLLARQIASVVADVLVAASSARDKTWPSQVP